MTLAASASAASAGSTTLSARGSAIVPLGALLPWTDGAALVAALALTLLPAGGRPAPDGYWLGYYLGYVVGVFAVLAGTGQHRLAICLRVGDQVPRLVGAAAVPAVLLLPAAARAGAGRPLAVVAGSAALLVAGRTATYALVRFARRCGLASEPALLVGDGRSTAKLAALLHAHPEYGLVPCGSLAAGPSGQPAADPPVPLLGEVSALPAVAAAHGVRRVIVCDDGGEAAGPALGAVRSSGVEVCVVPRLPGLGAAVPRGALDEIWGVPLVPLRAGVTPLRLRAKRATDLLLAPPLLLLAAPLLLVLAAALRLTGRGSVIFRQTRVSRGGRLVTVFKLRSMVDEQEQTRWAVELQRCGRLARALRATHLDELPQLVNVLRGELSLVGPRPERPYFVERFSGQLPHYADRHRMPAGLTGWAQVNGLHGDTSVAERAVFDNQYIEYWSPWLDLVILARTLVAMTRSGARG